MAMDRIPTRFAERAPMTAMADSCRLRMIDGNHLPSIAKRCASFVVRLCRNIPFWSSSCHRLAALQARVWKHAGMDSTLELAHASHPEQLASARQRFHRTQAKTFNSASTAHFKKLMH